MRLLAPLSGRLVPLEAVPDPVFAGRLLGDGVAIEPSEGLAVAPLGGEVVALFPHAVGLRGKDGVEVLVHIGIDSSQLSGVFEALVAQGELVSAGQPLVRFDLERLRQGAPSAISPVVLVAVPEGVTFQVVPVGDVTAGAILMELG